MAILPFMNNMVRMGLKGSDILDMLEWSVYDYNAKEHKGKFLQYSGKRKFVHEVWYDMLCISDSSSMGLVNNSLSENKIC
jgi:hypothetical protein